MMFLDKSPKGATASSASSVLSWSDSGSGNVIVANFGAAACGETESSKRSRSTLFCLSSGAVRKEIVLPIVHETRENRLNKRNSAGFALSRRKFQRLGPNKLEHHCNATATCSIFMLPSR